MISVHLSSSSIAKNQRQVDKYLTTTLRRCAVVKDGKARHLK